MSLIKCIVSMLSKNNMKIIAKTADNTDIMARLFLRNIQYVISRDMEVFASLLVKTLLLEFGT